MNPLNLTKMKLHRKLKSRLPTPPGSVLVLLVCAGVGLAGCVSHTIEPAYIPNVATSQNHEGLTTISWPSRKGYNYRLAVRSGREVIYDKKVYQGTGETIVVQFKLDPSKPLPDYVVKPEKVDDR